MRKASGVEPGEIQRIEPHDLWRFLATLDPGNSVYFGLNENIFCIYWRARFSDHGFRVNRAVVSWVDGRAQMPEWTEYYALALVNWPHGLFGLEWITVAWAMDVLEAFLIPQSGDQTPKAVMNRARKAIQERLHSVEERMLAEKAAAEKTAIEAMQKSLHEQAEREAEEQLLREQVKREAKEKRLRKMIERDAEDVQVHHDDALDPLLTVAEAAAQCGVLDSAIHQAIRCGMLPVVAYRPPGFSTHRRSYRVRQSALAHFDVPIGALSGIDPNGKTVERGHANGYLTIAEAAKILGVSRTCVESLCTRRRKNRIPRIRINGVWHIRRADALAELDRRAFTNQAL